MGVDDGGQTEHAPARQWPYECVFAKCGVPLSESRVVMYSVYLSVIRFGLSSKRIRK